MSANDFESKHPRKTDGKWKQADHPENEMDLNSINGGPGGCSRCGSSEVNPSTGMCDPCYMDYLDELAAGQPSLRAVDAIEYSRTITDAPLPRSVADRDQVLAQRRDDLALALVGSGRPDPRERVADRMGAVARLSATKSGFVLPDSGTRAGRALDTVYVLMATRDEYDSETDALVSAFIVAGNTNPNGLDAPGDIVHGLPGFPDDLDSPPF